MDEKNRKENSNFLFRFLFLFLFRFLFLLTKKSVFFLVFKCSFSSSQARAGRGQLGGLWTPEPPCDQTRGTLGSFGHWTPGPDPGPPWTGALGHLDPLVQDPLDLDPWNPDWGHLGHLGAFPILGHYLLFTLLGAGRGVARPHVALLLLYPNKITKSHKKSLGDGRLAP